MKRFWDKVEITEGCWQWTASTSMGYGRFWLDGRGQPAHRVSYELLVGPIPEGLDLDHLCRNRACVRPEHLEPVTRQENVNRGLSSTQGLKTHCPQGHDLQDEDNQYYDRSMNCIRCGVCKRARRREYYNASR